MTESFIDANGMTFTARTAGDSGELVMFLHGFPQSSWTWRAEIEAVANAGFRACAPDQRGYSPGARPDSIDAYRIERLVSDVLAIADALQAPQFHLVGHDWGGHLAWVTAALHPERVRTLAVISRPHPGAFIKAMQADAAQSSRSGHHRSFQRPEATDELLANDAHGLRNVFDGLPDEAAEGYLEVLGHRDALDAAINWYRAAGNSSIRPADVPSVSMPTLYVWGSADSTVGRAAAELTAEFVDGTFEFVAIPDVGHFVTDQVPGMFARHLLKHLTATVSR